MKRMLTAADIMRYALDVLARTANRAELRAIATKVRLGLWRFGEYTGQNVKLGDYYVREVERIGGEHRQVVRYEIVGTGRVEQVPRSRFERMARPA